MRAYILIALALVVLAGANAAGAPAGEVLYLVGDSTMRNESSVHQGWGDSFARHFDPARLQVVNAGVAGQSSRSFLVEGRWRAVLARVQPGDYVLIQFGHNDRGTKKGFGVYESLKGTGSETREAAESPRGGREIVLTYGAYLRRYIADIRARGALPILCSPVPRNVWQKGQVVRALTDYALWASEVATRERVPFLNLNELVAAQYEVLGKAKVSSRCFAGGDLTHTTREGAEVTAAIAAQAIRETAGLELKEFLRALVSRE